MKSARGGMIDFLGVTRAVTEGTIVVDLVTGAQ